MAGKNIYSLLRTFGGIAGEYANIIESEFAAANGTAYNPPESGELSYRRVNAARTIQLLANCPISVESFQTSAATIRLPANTAAEDTNEAGDGRLFFVSNSGDGNLIVQDYLGAQLHIIPGGSKLIIVGNHLNNWDMLGVNTGFVKSGTIAGASFTGSPKKASVAFDTPFKNAAYNIELSSTEFRLLTYENKTVNGFTVNANAAAALSGEVSWRASLNQET